MVVKFTKVKINGRSDLYGFVIPGPCPDWDYSNGTNARSDMHLYRPNASECYNRHIPIFTYDSVEIIGDKVVAL